LTDIVIDHIVICMPIRIMALNISGRGSFSDASLVSMCNSLTNLTTFRMNNCTTITLDSVLGIVNGLPSLTNIEFLQTWEVSIIFQLLFDKFETIHAMNIFACSFMGISKVSVSIFDISNYHCMKKTQETMTLDDGLKNKILSSCTFSSILELTVSNNVMSNDSLLEFSSKFGGQLSTLNLMSMTTLNFATMTEVAEHCTALKNLTIEKCPLRDKVVAPQIQVLAFCSSCKGLLRLTLHGLSFLTADFASDIGHFCPQLEVLKLTFCRISLKSIKYLAISCLLLKELRICSTTHKFSDAELCEAFQGHPALRFYTIDNRFHN
jgi:hypothetical protein